MTNSGITPPAPAPPKPASNNASQVVKIVTLPESLQNVSRAVRLEGEVVGQNRDGTTRIKTAEGNIDVSIRGRQPQPGTKLEIDVPPGSPPKQITVRPAPQAPPPPQTEPPLTTTTTTLKPAQGHQTPQAPPAATDGTTQQKPLPPAILPPALPDAPKTARPASALPPLAPDQLVRLVPIPADGDPALLQKMADPAKPLITAVTQQANLTAQKTQSGLIAALIQIIKSALPNTAVPPPAPAGSPKTIITNPAKPEPLTLLAKIVAITPPTGQPVFTAQPSSAPMPAPGTLNAVPPVTVPVSAITQTNLPVIQIPMDNDGALQPFLLQAVPAGTVTPGTQITLLPQMPISPHGGIVFSTTSPGMTGPPPATAAQSPAPAAASLPPAWRVVMPLMQPSPLWPVLDEIFQTFYQATPQAAQILGRIIPSPGNAATFGPAAMLFVASTRAGDLQTWIGDKKLEMLQKLGKGSLLSRLSAETSSLTQKSDGPGTEWRSYPVPLLWQNEISKVMLHTRQESGGQDQDNNEGGTRFLLDLSLPRMGDVQIDGYLAGKRLDLIIRTQAAISLPMQEAMKTAYADALNGTEIFGEITFQGTLKNWVYVLKGEEKIGVSI